MIVNSLIISMFIYIYIIIPYKITSSPYFLKDSIYHHLYIDIQIIANRSI